MLKTLHVKNLEKYQPGYKDRNLIWCKMYFSMINGDPEFEMLCEIDKMRLISFIMLEMQIKKPVPLDETYLSRKGFDFKKRPMSSTLQMLHTFIEIRNETVTEDSKTCDETVTQIREEEIKEKNREITIKKSNKVKHLDFVYLSSEELQKLIDKWPRTYHNKIETLNNYGHQKPKKFKEYQSHYHTILAWNKDQPVEQQENKTTNYLDSDYYKKATDLKRQGKTIDLKTAATRIMKEIKDKRKATSQELKP